MKFGISIVLLSLVFGANAFSSEKMKKTGKSMETATKEMTHHCVSADDAKKKIKVGGDDMKTMAEACAKKGGKWVAGDSMKKKTKITY